MDPLLHETILFLGAIQTRATYGAVAQILGVEPISMGARLGPRRPEASWIVSADSGLPTGYGPQEIHPALLSNNEVIRDGADLLRRLNVWRVSNNEQTVVQTSGQLKRPRSFTIAAVVMFGIGALYLAGAFLSATASSTDPFGLPEILVVVGPACLFVAYGLSILGLRRRAIALGWTVIGFSSILALFYPMIVILAWALHLWWFVRFRRRRSLLV